MKRYCAFCQRLREVYAQKEDAYDEWEMDDVKDSQLIFSGKRSTLKNGDVVAVPACKECFEELIGKE